MPSVLAHMVVKKNRAVLLSCLFSVSVLTWVMFKNGRWTQMPTRWCSTRIMGSCDAYRAQTINTGDILDYAESYLSELQSNYDPVHGAIEYGLDLGNISLSEYINDLETATQKYFSTPDDANVQGDAFEHAFDRLSLIPPTRELAPLNKKVYTTQKDVSLIPENFGRWYTVLPDWKVEIFNDTTMEAKVRGLLKGTKALELFESLPRKVLQTDMFRYVMLFFEGGIYTDSDTSPVIPVEKWGQPFQYRTPNLLPHLSRLLSIGYGYIPSPAGSEHADGVENGSAQPNKRSKGEQVYFEPPVADGGEEGEPGLIISIEQDCISNGWANDWRDRDQTQAIQITQWTLLARPGHTVLLDALIRVLQNTETNMQDEEHGVVSALHWSGPGVFTNSVFKYLLTRYGVHPDALLKQEEPVRIGDVLILPAGSFSNWAHDYVSGHTADSRPIKYGAVWHGYYGRWRKEDPVSPEMWVAP